MEGYQSVDAISRSGIFRALTRNIVVLLLVVGCASAQTSGSDSEDILRKLVSEKLWSEAATTCDGMSSRTSDAEHLCGLAFANAGKIESARQAFLRGRNAHPHDARFATDLAGLAFRAKDYPETAKWLLQAERIAPRDSYVNDFLGTVYFLAGNIEASLKYWNRVQRPQIEEVKLEPRPRLDPVLLDRALAISSGSLLTVSEYLTTTARLRATGVFPIISARLDARQDRNFNFVVSVQERTGFGSGKLDAFLSTFGSAAFQTITPEYYNIGSTGTNIKSLWRWDAEKRRVSAELSAPLKRKAAWRYRLGIDLRNENWNVENFSGAAGSPLGYLNTRRSAGFVEFQSINSGRWSWRTGGEVSYRDYRLVTNQILGGDLLADGYELKHSFRADYELLRKPERHYFVATFGATEVGRMWAGTAPVFAKLQGGLRQQWSANSRGDDYEFTHEVRAGRTAGDVPFDELFMLGLERDNGLKMRGHVGTRDGQKGSAPLGRNYFVSNLDFDKNIWGNGLVRFTAGPFLDVGKIGDPLSYLGSRRWLVDTGGQLKLRVLGVTVTGSYGRDLRGGRNALYATVTR